LAYWHHPRWTSHDGGIANDPDMASDLDAAVVGQRARRSARILILNGHVHYYERMARQNLTNGADANGMRQLIVGTGGVEHDERQPSQPSLLRSSCRSTACSSSR
jgi:hypothetical protein